MEGKELHLLDLFSVNYVLCLHESFYIALNNFSFIETREDLFLYEIKFFSSWAFSLIFRFSRQLAVGSLCGTVDLYDAYSRTVRYNDKFEFNYISKDQVMIIIFRTYSMKWNFFIRHPVYYAYNVCLLIRDR
jgi:hypothetical protein